jgi:hypothetical protein
MFYVHVCEALGIVRSIVYAITAVVSFVFYDKPCTVIYTVVRLYSVSM